MSIGFGLFLLDGVLGGGIKIGVDEVEDIVLLEVGVAIDDLNGVLMEDVILIIIIHINIKSQSSANLHVGI